MLFANSSINPAIATVSDNGLVTAIASGSIIVVARKDGALGMITVNVVTSGDGIPDDWEIANGMNPHDPFDAREGSDKDDLTALQLVTERFTNQVADHGYRPRLI